MSKEQQELVDKIQQTLVKRYGDTSTESMRKLFDSYDTIRTLLPVITGVISTLDINPTNLRAALTEDLLATDLIRPFEPAIREIPRREGSGLVDDIDQHVRPECGEASVRLRYVVSLQGLP